METRFETTEVSNVLQNLDDDHALYFLGLSLAANDLASNLEALMKIPDSENLYFFVTSLSILRELAKLVVEIEDSEFPQRFSSHSTDVFNELKKDLLSFEDKSFVKSTLKPIRDVTFHYSWSRTNGNQTIRRALSGIKKTKTIEIGLVKEGSSPLEQRYSYADNFRDNVLNQFLNKNTVSKISEVSVNIICFVDSLMVDLKQEHGT